ncbi:hypothetical protein C2845_PM14G17740 [Panicum miliaceum]|uniref:Uncharacterized protein n=1 Tax=Panicum miliaceum TaxID=4540 RepID=A0A3L6PT52_PANMI|nr:hypothetical protein C2845_PM14G17740 [Panicum miliaceum]
MPLQQLRVEKLQSAMSPSSSQQASSVIAGAGAKKALHGSIMAYSVHLGD